MAKLTFSFSEDEISINNTFIDDNLNVVHHLLSVIENLLYHIKSKSDIKIDINLEESLPIISKSVKKVKKVEEKVVRSENGEAVYGEYYGYR